MTNHYINTTCILREILPNNVLRDSLESNILNNEHNIGSGTLDDVCDCKSTNCIYKDIANKKFSRRQLEQIKCISEYKEIYNLETMDDAAMEWVNNGYASEFNRVYSIKKNNNEIIRHSDLLNTTRDNLYRKP